MNIVIILMFAIYADGALYEGCGRVVYSQAFIAGGAEAHRGEVPWHAALHDKLAAPPYKLVCGGSLINHYHILSAAHCFWDEEAMQQLPAARFAAAVGKLYRHWNNNSTREVDERQRADVREIHLPAHFRGSVTNFQHDIALVVVSSKLVCSASVRPVCLDFDIALETKHLQPGNKGKVAGWGLTSEEGEASRLLKVVELPYVDTNKCFNETSYIFHPLISGDKFCAGYKHSNQSVCRGDSGGGLSFPEREGGRTRYYLRGIASSAPATDIGSQCSVNDYATFTRISTHEHFIKGLWSSGADSDSSCELDAPLLQIEGCGLTHPGLGVNGTSGGELQYGEFPWTCAVLRIESVTNGTTGAVTTRDVFVRGGVLIHPSVVLIVGLYPPRDYRYRVRAGAGSGASAAGGRRYQLQDVDTVKATSGPLYILALLFLTAPMTLAPNVAMACLSPQRQRVPPGSSCVLTSWDHALDAEYNYEAKLLKVQVSAMEREGCAHELIRYKFTKEGYKLHDTLGCVTLHGRERTICWSMCRDMWKQYSPVFCAIESKEDQYMMYGFIVSGFNCHSHPLWRYYDVSHYFRNWIDKQVTAEGYDTHAYSAH